MPKTTEAQPVELGDLVMRRCRDCGELGVVRQLVEPEPGWRRALVGWGDYDQFVDLDQLVAP